MAAGPVLLLWFAVAAGGVVGQPAAAVRRRRCSATATCASCAAIARLTWRYFEVFAGPQENWLPPDNFQEQPGHRVAHRTSPTDMGLALLSNLAAHDLGYLSGGQLLDRTARAIESMEQLERHRGHFFNWYDTSTRKALRPLYVSTVDSGNLVGHVRVLRSGLLELPAGPVLPAGALEGLRDTLRVLAEQVGPSEAAGSRSNRLAAGAGRLPVGHGRLAERAGHRGRAAGRIVRSPAASRGRLVGERLRPAGASRSWPI